MACRACGERQDEGRQGEVTIKVAIVGLGRIGATYPSAGGVPRSHLAAVLGTPGMRVGALVDADEAARQAAARLAPGAACVASLDAVAAGSIDLVVDARPPMNRAALVRAAAAKGARGVILEKPVAMDVAGAAEVVAAARETGLAVRVNFHRRFDAGHQRTKTAMGEKPIGALAVYGKGLANYGSHLIDLMLEWMGPIAAVRAEERDRAEGSDPSIGFDVRFTSGAEAAVRTLPAAAFDVLDVTFFGAATRVDLMNGGAMRRLSRAMPDLVYPGYTHLAETASETSPVAGLAELHAAFSAHLNSGAPLTGATAADALAGMIVLEAVRVSHAGGGVWTDAKAQSLH